MRQPRHLGHAGAWMPSVFAAVAMMVMSLVLSRGAPAEELRLEDPFAAVDGQPVTIGRLHLVLTQRFPGKDPQSLDAKLRAAAATQLVRQQLALRSMLVQGGDAIRRESDAAVAEFKREVKKRGVPLANIARARKCDERAILDDVRWKHIWQRYLESQLTAANLRRFYEQNPQRYGGSSFEQLQNALLLKKEASAAMFAALVRRSADAKVEFFEAKLRPPEGYPIIPEKP
ncbi:MAG: hypothetical protein AAF958_08370 [Planctomycetota bacterium]